MALRHNSILLRAPHLEGEYHPTKNLTPFSEITYGSPTKVWWVCTKGHEWKQPPKARVLQRCGCPYCSGKRVSELNSLAARVPHLAMEYHSTKNPKPPSQVAYQAGRDVWWICKKGHEWQESPNARVSGHYGCPYCSGKRVSELNALSVRAPHLEKEWHPKNIIRFADVSFGSDEEVWWVCAKGHEWEATIGNRAKTRGTGCPYCAGKLLTDSNSLLVNAPHLRSEYSSRNSEPFDTLTYGLSDQKFWWACPDCFRDYQCLIPDRRRGRGCPSCSTTHTKLEQAFEALLGVERFNSMLTDLGVPHKPDVKLSKTLYANADGLYFHSQNPNGKRPLESKYHFKMRQAFETKGLRLLQFYEDEVYHKPRIVRSMVNAILGKSPDRIAARKCTIQRVPQFEADKFLDENHIIGRAYRCRYQGLYLEDKLVQLIAVKLEQTPLEIVRSCGKLDTVVVGGFQKLLQHVIREYRPAKVKTLIDLRYADGHSLVKAGFKLENTAMNYEYTNGKTRKDKRQFRVPAGTPEEPYAAEQGWYRIYNAGRARYTLNL